VSADNLGRYVTLQMAKGAVPSELLQINLCTRQKAIIHAQQDFRIVWHYCTEFGRTLWAASRRWL